ncbi:MAG TPA: hypothetical protein VGO34_00670 [Alphaproteobacteria bacterium]|jgi:hypothetical protein
MHVQSRSHFTVGLLAAVGLLLAACGTSGPVYPLYSSAAVTGSFGYSEQKLSPNSFKVTYVAPVREVADSRNAIDERRQSLLTVSNDMAIWRASDLALANGQKEFRVTRRDNDVDVQRDTYESYPYRPYYRRGPPYYGPAPYFGPPWPERDSYVRLRARTTLVIEFGHQPGTDFFIADEAIARLRQTYPGADQTSTPTQQGLMFP